MGVRQASTTNTELTLTYLSVKSVSPTIGHRAAAPGVRRRRRLCGVRRATARNHPALPNVSIDVHTSRDMKFPDLIDIARSLWLSTVIRAPSTGVAAMTVESGRFATGISALTIG
jgi:hypothetical protein